MTDQADQTRVLSDAFDTTTSRRFVELVSDGNALLAKYDDNSAVGLPERPTCIAWLMSTVNLLDLVMPVGNRYRREAQRLLPKIDETLWTKDLATVLGILRSAAAEWQHGLIGTLEFRFVGLAFEDFLEHARSYNEQDKKIEAAVLASAVLEDTVRRLCKKHQIPDGEQGLDASINALKSARVLGKVKAERLRAFATLRNKAFHAEWDAFDRRDLTNMIDGLTEILETHFE